MSNRTLFVVWDDLGLEAVVDLTEFFDENNLLTTIANPNSGSRDPTVNWQLRARYNGQRNYQLYMVAVDPEITREDFVNYFEQDPEAVKKLVKEKGQEIGY